MQKTNWPSKLLVGLALSLLYSLSAGFAPSFAEEWKRYQIKEVAFEAPASWQVTSKRRNREVDLQSPDSQTRLWGYWWFPDEPLLGYDDLVSHKKIIVAGKPALLIYSRFHNNHSLKLVFDEARKDGRRFTLLLDSTNKDFSNGSPLFDEILSRVVYGNKKGAITSEQPNTKTAQGATSGTSGDDGRFYDDGGDFSLNLPAGWRKGTAERDGHNILTLHSPDKKAILLVVSVKADGSLPPDKVFSAYEKLFFEETFLSDSIDADQERRLGGLSAHYLEFAGEVYSIEGVRPAFDTGRLQKYTLRSENRAYDLFAVSANDASSSLKQVLEATAESFQPGQTKSSAGSNVQIPKVDDQQIDTVSGSALGELRQLVSPDCHMLDLGNWRHRTRDVLESRSAAHLQWVALCQKNRFPVFGMIFDFDPRGQTNDFFYPLYDELLRANSRWPLQLWEVRDRVIISVSKGGQGELTLDYQDLPAAPSGATNTNVGNGTELTAVNNGPVATGPKDDPATMLGEGENREIVLFDGRELGERWKGYRAHGGDYEKHARLEGGVLQVDVPEKSGWGKVGIYSEEPLLWLDRFGKGAEHRLTVTFDPARTTGFVVDISTHYGLNGNDPGRPGFLLHWRKTAAGGAKASLFADSKKLSEVDLPNADAPEKVEMIITPEGVRFEAPGAPAEVTPWEQAVPFQGFRIYVYTHPDEKNQPVKMALKEIRLTQKAGNELAKRQPAKGVEPLPVATLFEGNRNDWWEPADVGTPVEKYGHFQSGGFIADVPAKTSQWPKCGLLSTKPVLEFDERLEITPFGMRLRFDPKLTTGFQIMFHSNKIADMWGQHVTGAISFIRHTQGRWAGNYLLSIRTSNAPYGIWERPVDSRWVERNWDGTLELEFGDRRLFARIPGGTAVHGNGFSYYNGAEKYMAVYSLSEKTYAAARMVLQKIETGWSMPPNMTSLERWRLVDNSNFDPDLYLDDLGKEIQKEEAAPGFDPLADLIRGPRLSPPSVPEPPFEKRSSLWDFLDLFNPISTATAAECDTEIDTHLDEMRRVNIALSEQPDVTKAFIELGVNLFGAAKFKEGGWSEFVQKNFSRLQDAIQDGNTIGEDLKAGREGEASLHIMQALLNIGFSSDKYGDTRSFRQTVSKRVRDTWAQSLRKLSPEKAEKLIIETANKFTPGRRVDAKGILKELYEKGSKFDLGKVFGEGFGNPDDTRANISAALWTLTNNTLSTVSPHYKAIKAVADTVAVTAKATKAFVVNDRVRDMYKVWKEEIRENGGLESKAFYDARTVIGDRFPLTEVKDLMRTSSSDEIDDKVAEQRLFKMFEKWYDAEKKAKSKSDRFTGLKDRFKNLDCRIQLERATWPKPRSAMAAAYDEFKKNKNWGDAVGKSWSNYWSSCSSEIELLNKYAEVEAQIRAEYSQFMKPGNKCNSEQWIDHYIDQFICRYLHDGKNAYQERMAEVLIDCGLVDKNDKRISKMKGLNHSKFLATLEKLGIEPPKDLFNCLCRRAGYGSSSTSQYYHPDTIGKYDKRYSCNQPGPPCVVSGWGCTRHPLPSNKKVWNGCMDQHKLGVKNGPDGKPDPNSGIRLDQAIKKAMQERRAKR